MAEVFVRIDLDLGPMVDDPTTEKGIRKRINIIGPRGGPAEPQWWSRLAFHARVYLSILYEGSPHTWRSRIGG